MNNYIDKLIPFSCLPPHNIDEWINLKPFVETYNSLFERNYILESCPEKDHRNTPEPEILLRDGDNHMVVERKIIPLPVDYVRNHQLWHEFSNRLIGSIVEQFSDNLYIFRIQDVHIPNRKKDAIKLANEISSTILEYELRIKATEGRFSGGIYSDDSDGSIPWSFITVSDIDREEYLQDSGIISELGISRKWYSPQDITEEFPKLKKRLLKLITSSIVKFNKYSDCLKILIIEPYSSYLRYPVDILADTINSLEIPQNLDQIWIAKRIEFDLYESIVDYEMVKNNRN